MHSPGFIIVLVSPAVAFYIAAGQSDIMLRRFELVMPDTITTHALSDAA